MQQTRRKGIGLVFPALSAGVFSSVKKGSLFERSEFLPFSVVKGVSRRKKSVLNFSLFLSFVSRQKKESFCKFATKSDAVDITNLLILHNL